MGKLAEIKDMEQAAQQNDFAKEWESFARRQEQHNVLVEKMLKVVAGCAIGVLAIAVLAAGLLLPKASALVSDANQITAQTREMLPQLEQVVEDAQEITQQVRESNPKELLESLNGLSQQGQQALTESMQEMKKAVDVLEEIDIAALNEAVDNLGKAVSPLAKLFGGK